MNSPVSKEDFVRFRKLTFPAKTKVVGLLSSHLLNGQRNCVQRSIEVDVDTREVRLDPFLRLIFLEPSAVSYSSDGKDVVYTAELRDSFLKPLDLGVPVGDVDLGGHDRFAMLAEFGYGCLNAFLVAIGANVSHGGDRAYYSPATDSIRLPMPEAFAALEEYYAAPLQ